MSKRKKTKPSAEDIRTVLDTYARLMGLTEWKFDLQYHGVAEGEYMTCVPSPGYLRATISVNMDMMDSMDTLIRTIVHELIHVQLSHYTEAAVIFAGDNRKVLDDLEEFVVTQIERWPLWGIE